MSDKGSIRRASTHHVPTSMIICALLSVGLFVLYGGWELIR
jgi:hypothetical protein